MTKGKSLKLYHCHLFLSSYLSHLLRDGLKRGIWGFPNIVKYFNTKHNPSSDAINNFIPQYSSAPIPMWMYIFSIVTLIFVNNLVFAILENTFKEGIPGCKQMSAMIKYMYSNTDKDMYEFVLSQERNHEQNNSRKRMRLYGFQEYDENSNAVYSKIVN